MMPQADLKAFKARPMQDKPLEALYHCCSAGIGKAHDIVAAFSRHSTAAPQRVQARPDGAKPRQHEPIPYTSQRSVEAHAQPPLVISSQSG